MGIMQSVKVGLYGIMAKIYLEPAESPPGASLGTALGVFAGSSQSACSGIDFHETLLFCPYFIDMG
jgi:hypothetical protein